MSDSSTPAFILPAASEDSDTMIHPLPTIVVVDSERSLEDQMRTMIILFRPTDAALDKTINK